MAKFTVEITDPDHLAGITAARNAKNEGIAATVSDETGAEIDNPEYIKTDKDYVQFVMSSAAESYYQQHVKSK